MNDSSQDYDKIFSNSFLSNGSVATYNGLIVGFVGRWRKISTNILKLGYLVVDSNFRGLGIGTNLIKFEIKDIHNATVMVESWIHPVTSGEATSDFLFKKLGFIEIDHNASYWEKDCKSTNDCLYRTDRCVCSRKLMIKHFGG
ncbi:hypothetical protein D3C81_1016410 [compost metagenome]